MIELSHIYKKYETTGTNALYDINLSVDQGEFVYIIGPTGAGKSTLIKLLDAEEKPTKGTIKVVGIDLGDLSIRQIASYRRNIGLSSQNYDLLSSKTVFENIAYALEVIGVNKKVIAKRVKEVLEIVDVNHDIDGNVFPAELSGGMQQRVAIARAIVNRPKLLIVDEPTDGLDPIVANAMMACLEKINEKYGSTIVMVTHDQNVVNNHQKRTIILDRGHVVADLPKEKGAYAYHG